VLQSLQKVLHSTTLYYKKLAQSTSQYYFVLQSLHKALPSTTWQKALPSTTLYYKACTKHFSVLLCITKLAQSTFQYSVLLCTTKLAQSTSQYYFVLQSLHMALPSTTLHCRACKKYFTVLLCTTKLAQRLFPVLLCTTKLAQSTSQYYFALQSLHKALPSTTLYYKACTKHFPVLLCTAKLAQSASMYYFVKGSWEAIFRFTDK